MSKILLSAKTLILMVIGVAMVSCNGNSSGSNKVQQSANTTQPSVPGETTIVYVRNDSLLTNYTLFKELSEEMLKKEENARATLNEQQRDLEQDAMDFQRKLQNNAFATQQRAEEENARLMKKQGELQALSEKLQNELLAEQQKNSTIVMDSVHNVLKEVSDEFGYKIIMSDPLYGVESLDITGLVLERLNKKYKPTEK